MNAGLPKRSEDDCDMATSLQASDLTEHERMLLEAARRNKCNLIQQLLSKGMADVNCRNNLDRTALHMAVSQGHEEAVALLVERKADIEISDKYGMTALLCAAYFGHKKIVDLLHSKGAYVKRKNKLGQSLIHIAAEKGDVDLLEDYLSKTKKTTINDIDKNNRSPLLIASLAGHVDIVERLLRYEETRVDLIDSHKKTALHLAAECGSPRVLNSLLKTKLNDHINDKDDTERAPLHYVVDKGHIGAIKTLMNTEAEITLTCERDNTVFHIAASKSHQQVLKVLRQFDKEQAVINEKNAQGNTALHVAALLDDAATIYTLVSLNINKEIKNNRKQTALHAAVEQNKAHAVEALLLCGSNLNETDVTNKTPLTLATQSSFISIVDMIIKTERLRDKSKFKEIDETDIIDQCDGRVYTPADYKNNARYNIHENNTTEDNNVMTGEDISLEAAIQTGQIPAYRLMEFNQSYAEAFTLYLWKLAFHHLRANEWKGLAKHWNFKSEHVVAIDHQDTGDQSHKQHGYRVLCIWFHGIDSTTTPVRELYEALVAIGRRTLAEKMRKKLSKGSAQYQNSNCSLL